MDQTEGTHELFIERWIWGEEYICDNYHKRFQWHQDGMVVVVVVVGQDRMQGWGKDDKDAKDGKLHLFPKMRI